MKCKHIAVGAALACAMAMQSALWAAEGPADPNAPVAPTASYSDVFSDYQNFVADSGAVANPQSNATSGSHQMQGMQGMQHMQRARNMPGMGEMKVMESNPASSDKSKQGDMKDMQGMENMPGMGHGQMQHMQH